MYTDWIDYDMRAFTTDQIMEDLAAREIPSFSFLVREDQFTNYDDEKIIQRVYISV